MTDQPLEPDEKAAPQETPAAETTPPEPAPEPAHERRLYRSRDDRVIAGVCGGLGEYLKVDPVLVRIAAIVLVFAGGAGLVLYLVGWIAIPEEPELAGGEPTPRAGAPERATGAAVLGFVFVALGLLFLADEIWPDFLSWQYIWPVGLIAIGLAILLRGKR